MCGLRPDNALLTTSSPPAQVSRLPHMQKHLGRAGLLRYRGNAGYKVQVSPESKSVRKQKKVVRYVQGWMEDSIIAL